MYKTVTCCQKMSLVICDTDLLYTKRHVTANCAASGTAHCGYGDDAACRNVVACHAE